MSDVDAVVVGAGVIGLAVVRALALTGRSVIVLETERLIGSVTSSRNSEVIHSGIYYPQGSLKARLCVEGRQRLYEFCDAHGVGYQRCGKLIVATNEKERPAVEALFQKGLANGVEDLVWLSAAEATAMEPALHCVGALFAPSTGILDSHGFMLAMRGDAEDHGAAIAFNTPFLSAKIEDDGIVISAGGAEPTTLKTAALINCAGLQASKVARAIVGLEHALVPETRYAKGNYFALTGRSPFRRLIYPAPHSHGLGVHLTFDLAGQVRFGPDVEWIEEIDYAVDPRRCEGFSEAIRSYWPGLRDDALVAAYAGIRPKISGPADSAADFRLDGPERHGVRGLVNLFGIESPGLTSSLAIAEQVVASLPG